jgi:hypothetical protein
MFDKNDFKEKFRCWTELNPNASYEEAKLLCDLLIPIDVKENFSWLEEQSLAWFLWKKESLLKSRLNLFNDSEVFESYSDGRKIM